MTNLFLDLPIAQKIAALCGTPTFVYSEKALKAGAAAMLAFPHAHGLTVRYAMKAASNAALLKIFHQLGIQIDASTGYEVHRALRAGIPAAHICLSTQELPADFAALLDLGISINACSLSQIAKIGQQRLGAKLGLRFNPGTGSGGTKKTNTGGPASSFGIWHEQLPEVQSLVAQHNLKVNKIHTHIGSGSDPEVWVKVATLSLNLVRQFPAVTHLDLGGGYKVGRMPHEKTTDLQLIGAPVKQLFVDFAAQTGRKIHLEIEPGTYLAANTCCLLTTVQDMVDTGPSGYRFLKIDAGMTEVCRPSLYGSQHPMAVLPKAENSAHVAEDYVVVGHCCESGDMLTPAAGEPETLEPRTLAKAQIGDYLVIGGAGAYCSSMSTKNYNSFPEAPEVLLREDGTLKLIRQRQTLDQILANEIAL